MNCVECGKPMKKGDGVRSHGKLVHRHRCLHKRKCKLARDIGLSNLRWDTPNNDPENKPIELRTFDTNIWHADTRQLDQEYLKKDKVEDRLVRRMEHWWNKLTTRQQVNAYLKLRSKIRGPTRIHDPDPDY